MKLSILDQLTTPVAVSGRDLNCIYSNQAWADFFLPDLTESESMKSLDFLPAELKRITGICYLDAIDHGTVSRREISLNGINFHSVISPLKREDGMVIAAVETLFEKHSDGEKDDCKASGFPSPDDVDNSCGDWVPVFIPKGNKNNR